MEPEVFTFALTPETVARLRQPVFGQGEGERLIRRLQKELRGDLLTITPGHLEALVRLCRAATADGGPQWDGPAANSARAVLIELLLLRLRQPSSSTARLEAAVGLYAISQYGEKEMDVAIVEVLAAAFAFVRERAEAAEAKT